MPALIGGVALPLLLLLGCALNKLPEPNKEDIAMKSERETLNGQQRWELFKSFMPFLSMLFVANIAIVVLRDIKEDFLVNIIDGLCERQSESIIRPVRSYHHGNDCNVGRFFRAGPVPPVTCDMAVYPEPVPVYCLSDFPDYLFRPVHRLFQDTWKCRVLYRDDRLSGIHRNRIGSYPERVL